MTKQKKNRIFDQSKTEEEEKVFQLSTTLHKCKVPSIEYTTLPHSHRI